MDQKLILEKLRSVKADLYARYPIEYLALFGSVARGDNHQRSDVDILVAFNGKVGSRYFDFAQELENFLQNKVDLISRKAVKPKYFKEIKSDLIYV